MARMPKPWRRRDNAGAWYAQIDGRQVKLAPASASFVEAQQALARIMAGVPDENTGLQVGAVVAQFLAACAGRVNRGELSPATAKFYDQRLALFAAACGDVSVDLLKPSHVLAWLDGSPHWGSTYRAGCVTSVNAAFNWAVKMGLIPVNPIRHTPKPRPRRTQAIPHRAVVDRAFAACQSQEFALFLRVVFATGCRIAEALRLEAKDIDWGRSLWHRASKTTHATGKERVVHLPGDLLELLRAEAARFPDGPLLRHSKGKPWTMSGLNSQIRRLRTRAGGLPGLTIQSLRHLFVTDALERGVPIATVAELVGHASTALISKAYSHLSDRHEHLKEALHVVRPSVAPVLSPVAPANRHESPASLVVPSPSRPAVPAAKRRARRRGKRT